MTEKELRNIFDVRGDLMKVGKAYISVSSFLHGQGFAEVEPTREAMLAHDGGVKGYGEFIEMGNFAVKE